MRKVLLWVFVVGCLMAEGETPKGYFARPRQLCQSVPAVYQEICESFYRRGAYERMLQAKLDVRRDGTPNIVLDRNLGRAEITIVLSLNPDAYREWAEGARLKMDRLQLSTSLTDFEEERTEMIAGQKYCLGENEYYQLRQLNYRNAPWGNVIVNVRLVDEELKDVRMKELALDGFSHNPLHHLYADLDRHQQNVDRDSGMAKLTFTGLTKDELDRIRDCICTVVQN